MLRTAEEVIDAVGGTAAAASLAGVGMSAVSNWRKRGAIPAENFLTFSQALARAEKEADPSLFGLKEAAE